MIKVAGYCRVSTDKGDQANSFETQQRYFREYIERHPDWELHAIYADEGITGTSTKKRARFNQMISDAYEGKFRLIITKEVSRFSRNVLDTIAYTRELKSIGVAVLFMTDAIHTMDPDAELRLSIMASIAQEESRRTSARVTWGQTRQMEKGVVFGRSLLGYDVKNGQIIVNPEGAEIVKLIFQKYAVEQVSTREIAKFLSNIGCPTQKGNLRWQSGSVIKILRNEKYVGDLVQKKTYTTDFLTHEKRKNTGEVPLICIQHHHEPIISREIWNLAQERLRTNNKHRAGNTGHSSLYAFSGKIKCGECGSSFVCRIRKLSDGTVVRRWSCGTVVRDGAAACSIGKLVRDDDAMQMVKTAISQLQFDKEFFSDQATELALSVLQNGETSPSDRANRLAYEIDCTTRKKEEVMDAYFSGIITKDEMLSMKARYEQLLEQLQKQYCALAEQGISVCLEKIIRTEVDALLNGDTESEVFIKSILDRITVFKDRHLELRLNDLPHVFHFTC